MALKYKNNGRYVYETHNVWNKQKKMCVETAMKQMRNWMCKVYDNDHTIPTEPNKIQNDIMKIINNTVGIL